jgi:hypothetical protein
VATVTNLTATPSLTSVALTWDAVSGADGYEHRTRISAGTWGAWTAEATTSVTVTGLTEGTDYEHEVRAYDERGVGPEGSVSGATSSPAASTAPTRLYWPQTSGSQLNATDNNTQYMLWSEDGYPIGDRWCWLRVGTGGTWSLVKRLQQEVLSEDILIKTFTAVGGETQIQLGISTTASAPASASFVANFPAALVAGDVIDAQLKYTRGSDYETADWYWVTAVGSFNYVDINY